MFKHRFAYFIICSLYLIGDKVFVSTGSSNLDGNVPFESKSSSLSRVTRQAKKCGTREFKCKSGQCINEDNQCDGVDHCRDGSDETAEACRSVPCPPYLFRCAYGACINGDLECDGKKDCKDNSDETSPKCKNQPVVKPTNNCGSNSFQCNSGECIDDLDLCDGIKTCKDASDESIEACSNVDCPGFTFRCSYGGCVSKEARCNGQVECIDGSDEKGCTLINPIQRPNPPPSIVTPTPSTEQDPKSCRMPDQPAGGNYHIGGGGAMLNAGELAPPSTALTYRCRPGFKLAQLAAQMILNTTYCFDGNWIPGIPECKQVCPPFNSPKLEVICRLGGATIDCEYATDRTIAELKCAANYEDLQISDDPYRSCLDGSWDRGPPNCIPGISTTSRPQIVVQHITNVFIFINQMPNRNNTYSYSNPFYNMVSSSNPSDISDSELDVLINNIINNQSYVDNSQLQYDINDVLNNAGVGTEYKGLVLPLDARFGSNNDENNVIKDVIKDKWVNKLPSGRQLRWGGK